MPDSFLATIRHFFLFRKVFLTVSSLRLFTSKNQIVTSVDSEILTSVREAN